LVFIQNKRIRCLLSQSYDGRLVYEARIGEKKRGRRRGEERKAEERKRKGRKGRKEREGGREEDEEVRESVRINLSLLYQIVHSYSNFMTITPTDFFSLIGVTVKAQHRGAQHLLRKSTHEILRLNERRTNRSNC